MAKKIVNTPHKTWLEIDRHAVEHNVRAFRKLIGPKVQLWAVVKSNAYGHGLTLFSKLLNEQKVNGFCVDSVIEGLKLRQEGIKKPILVLGPTLNKDRYVQAKKAKLTLTISSFEALKQIVALKNRAPEFHIKVDTGMHRQGFLISDIESLMKEIRNPNIEIRNVLTGVCTHFANPGDREFTEMQFSAFRDACAQFEKAGFKDLIRHTASTDGALADSRYHLDAVRIGAGLYGFLPSKLSHKFQKIKPALSWRSVISEIKEIPKGEWVGYNRLFQTSRPTKLAIVPIGYWHGIDRRAFPGMEVLVKGKRVPIIGKVSMDMITIDITDIPARVGDRVTLLGRDGKEYISPQEFSALLGTTPHEALTRINPLIERMAV